MKLLKIFDAVVEFIPLLYFIFLSIMYWFYGQQPSNFELAILIFMGYAGYKNGKH